MYIQWQACTVHSHWHASLVYNSQSQECTICTVSDRPVLLAIFSDIHVLYVQSMTCMHCTQSVTGLYHMHSQWQACTLWHSLRLNAEVADTASQKSFRPFCKFWCQNLNYRKITIFIGHLFFMENILFINIFIILYLSFWQKYLQNSQKYICDAVSATSAFNLKLCHNKQLFALMIVPNETFNSGSKQATFTEEISIIFSFTCLFFCDSIFFLKNTTGGWSIFN